MKKLFAMLLAVAMILSLATVAFAADDVAASDSYVSSVVLNKLYNIVGAEDAAESDADEAAAVYPHETLSFVSTPAESNPTTDNLTVADWTVTGPNGTMAITLPSYTEVGKYYYTITETAGNAQAATYSTDEITLAVLVEYNEDHTALVATLYAVDVTVDGETNTTITGTDDTGETVYKLDTFVNEYKVGKLTVEKTVTGNLASKDQEFTMKVEFTSAKPVLSDITIVDGSTGAVSTIAYGTGWTSNEVTINVEHGETVTFYNIPEGVEYVVTEDASHFEADANGSNPATGYTQTNATNDSGVISSTVSAVSFTNTKDTSVETGIVLDSMPYIAILAIAAFGMFAMMSKKRYEV